MSHKRLGELFIVKYGLNLELNALNLCSPEDKNAVKFVSRTTKNNGVSAVVEKIADLEPIPAGTISVPTGGNGVLTAFLQFEPYYSGRDLYYLTPCAPMSDKIKLFYCLCLRANRYKYNYGRQANKTLEDILVPDITSIPKEFLDIEIEDYSNLSNAFAEQSFSIDPKDWKDFKYSELFDIKKGYYNKKPEHKIPGNIPFIGASRENNGITELYSLDDIALYKKDGSTDFEEPDKKIFKGNCITVVNNGASVGYAFYQEDEFTCSHDVNPIYLKNHVLNKYIAFFLIPLIEKEKSKWCYGRKWRPARMIHSTMKLPAKKDRNGQLIKDEYGGYIPDWESIESYIKTIPYSSSI
ncbi:hypothetical protein C162_00225 [Paenibacillus sp. FSL R7-269]|uniref:restriction endonuclease subunit S n=1 Tax=Paenibacillus sp. FSL R7-269 TaxID=1226755 RepID=UPI0003E2AEB6|nr:restriction endonuclease subunit S [Paenibacillus sp. FSL R7-269]ETT56791.1 hypothetical protein C162_00225 [Paenibacillus sp. FSL R7-269]